MPAYRYQKDDRPLDGYTIQYALGRGGFGEVYFAVSDSGREVALKVVQNFEDIELRGIRHCMNLKSPHLVTIFDVRYAADGVPWVIMEYVAGPSLREIIDESPNGLGPQRSAFLCRELAKGIGYLHDAGVVHRDLKPHNVFFENGLVKVGDYSLSKAITTSHRSSHTMTVGSVHYMAPEISRGHYDKTVDIYALGVILYEMLRGQPPYVGESMGEILMKHLSSEPDVSDLPDPFAATIAKAMRRDPSERFQTAQAMADSLLGGDELQRQLQSFDPMTLSKVAKRSEQLTSNRELRTAQPLADTFTTPALLRETKSIVSAAAEDAPPEQVDLFQQFGLWYSPSEIRDRNPDKLSQPVRFLIAVLVGALFSLYGSLSGINGEFFRETVSQLALIHVFISFGVCIAMLGLVRLYTGNGIWCGFLVRRNDNRSFEKRVLIGLVTRACLAAAAYLILSYVARNSIGSNEREFVSFVSGIMLSLIVMDWRCFIAPHRRHRILLRPTIGVGLVAILGSTFVIGEPQHLITTTAWSMSLALGLQLVAPLQRSKLIGNQVGTSLRSHRVKQASPKRVEISEEIVR